MTFAEKLVRLRKREGSSQEELAAFLGVSRQAVSRWEQGTAMPDAPNLLKLRQRFQVSLDWLLEDACGWDALPEVRPGGEETAPKAPCQIRLIVGCIVTGISLLGLLLLGILGSVLGVGITVIEAAGAEWERIYTGLAGFLKYYRLEWLCALLCVTAVCGMAILWFPQLQALCAGLQKRWRERKAE